MASLKLIFWIYDIQMSACVWGSESINSLWTVQWHKVKPKSEILYSSRSWSRAKMRRKRILPKWGSGGWLGQKNCVSHWNHQVVCHQTHSFTFFLNFHLFLCLSILPPNLLVYFKWILIRSLNVLTFKSLWV